MLFLRERGEDVLGGILWSSPRQNSLPTWHPDQSQKAHFTQRTLAFRAKSNAEVTASGGTQDSTLPHPFFFGLG